MTLNRRSGLCVACLGLLLLTWIIPSQTETVVYDWLQPATLPNITAAVMMISGLIQFVFPSGKEEFRLLLSLRTGLFVLFSLAGLFLMSRLGFPVAAPILVVVVMVFIGERRPLWLVLGIILIPAAVWFSVTILLNRSLP